MGLCGRSGRAKADALIAADELHPDLVGLLGGGLTMANGGVFFTRELGINRRLRHVNFRDSDLDGIAAELNAGSACRGCSLFRTPWAVHGREQAPRISATCVTVAR